MTETFSYLQKFNDFEIFSNSMQAYDVDLRKLDSGSFQAKLHQFLSGASLLSSFTATRSFEVQGSAPLNLVTFGIPTEQCKPFVWRNLFSDGNTIQVYNGNTELEMVTKQLFQAIDLSVPHGFLNRQCELMELPGLDDIIGDAAMLRCHPQDMKILRNALANVCQTLGDTPALINSSNMQYIINYEIPRLLLKTISVSETKKNIHNKSKKYHALNIAVEYIKANQSKNITLDSLCMESQVSARTLQHAFLEHFGQSPKTYLKVQRLNSVYKELRESEPVTTKITHVAYRHGFNHLSQFASDYKKLFGELPSVTLSKEK